MNPCVGIDIGWSSMYMFAEQEDGQLLERTVPTGRECEQTYILKEIHQFISELGYTPAGVGVGVVGLVEDNDRVKLSDMPALTGLRAEHITDGRIPVQLLNDVKAATMAEAVHYPDQRTIAVLLAGYGLAVGVVADGTLLQGARGWSGELGYTLVSTEGGTVKSLDHLAGEWAILDQAGVGQEEMIRRIDGQDEQAIAIIEEAGYYLGVAMTNVIHLYNPDVLIVGGSALAYKGYLERGIAVAKEHTIPSLLEACSIVRAQSEQSSIAQGAREYIRSYVINSHKEQ